MQKSLMTDTQKYVSFVVIAGVVLIGAMFFLQTFTSQTSFTYSEDGKLLTSDISGHVSVLAEGNLAGQAPDGSVLYTAPTEESARGGSGDIDGSDLIVRDSTGKSKVIAKDIWVARFSPDGKNVVAASASDNKLHLLDVDGTEKAQIGNHGSNPIFTHDGKHVVYHKLADQGKDFFDLWTNAKGLAIYDVTTGTEKMLTDQQGDDHPIGFSADQKYFYFNAGRPYDTSPVGVTNIEPGLYSLDMATGKVQRLTNVDEKETAKNGATMSTIAPDALWTTDRLKAISSIPTHGTWVFTFDGKGGLASVEQVSDGDSARWIAQDKTFAVRTSINGKDKWDVIAVTK